MVEAEARQLLTSEEVLEGKLGWRKDAIRRTIASFEDELRRLDRKSNENVNAVGGTDTTTAS